MKLPFAFKSGPSNVSAAQMYDASVEAFMDALHTLPDLDVETPVSEVMQPNDVVGGLIQSSFMSGYQRALQDIAEGSLPLVKLFDAWFEMQRGDGRTPEDKD